MSEVLGQSHIMEISCVVKKVFLILLPFHVQDESQDIYKRQQLRELAMLNSNFREESPQLSGSVSPFTSNEIKRVKTDQ